MNTRLAATTAGIAAAGALTVGLLAAPADAHSAKPVTHTIRLRTTVTGTLNYNRTTSAESDKAKIAGKLAGFDVVLFHGTSGDVALGLKGGLLYGHLKFNTVTEQIGGTVTGGTGAYKSAKGTITATNVNAKGTVTDVVIKWHK
jgi:hypothetical protein